MSDLFVIPTRQKADILFQSTVPLPRFGFYDSPVMEVSGYARIVILAVSNLSFGLNIEEAVSVTPLGVGDFVQTDSTILAAAVGGNFQIATSVLAFGRYMKMIVGNMGPGAQSFFNFIAKGIPLP